MADETNADLPPPLDPAACPYPATVAPAPPPAGQEALVPASSCPQCQLATPAWYDWHGEHQAAGEGKWCQAIEALVSVLQTIEARLEELLFNASVGVNHCDSVICGALGRKCDAVQAVIGKCQAKVEKRLNDLMGEAEGRLGSLGIFSTPLNTLGVIPYAPTPGTLPQGLQSSEPYTAPGLSPGNTPGMALLPGSYAMGSGAGPGLAVGSPAANPLASGGLGAAAGGGGIPGLVVQPGNVAGSGPTVSLGGGAGYGDASPRGGGTPPAVGGLQQQPVANQVGPASYYIEAQPYPIALNIQCLSQVMIDQLVAALAQLLLNVPLQVVAARFRQPPRPDADGNLTRQPAALVQPLPTRQPPLLTADPDYLIEMPEDTVDGSR